MKPECCPQSSVADDVPKSCNTWREFSRQFFTACLFGLTFGFTGFLAGPCVILQMLPIGMCGTGVFMFASCAGYAIAVILGLAGFRLGFLWTEGRRTPRVAIGAMLGLVLGVVGLVTGLYDPKNGRNELEAGKYLATIAFWHPLAGALVGGLLDLLHGDASTRLATYRGYRRVLMYMAVAAAALAACLGYWHIMEMRM